MAPVLPQTHYIRIFANEASKSIFLKHSPDDWDQNPELKKRSTNSFWYLAFWTSIKFCVPESQTQFAFLLLGGLIVQLFCYSWEAYYHGWDLSFSNLHMYTSKLNKQESNRNTLFPEDTCLSFLQPNLPNIPHSQHYEMPAPELQHWAGVHSALLAFRDKTKKTICGSFFSLSKSISEKLSKYCILKSTGV